MFRRILFISTCNGLFWAGLAAFLAPAWTLWSFVFAGAFAFILMCLCAAGGRGEVD